MTEYENEGQGSVQKSAMNSAVAILWRIDGLWKDVHKHAREINYPKWNEDLEMIWLELVEDSAPGDEEKYNKINKELMQLYIYGLGERMQLKSPTLHAKIMNLQKIKLMEKSVFLRKLQREQGKSGKYQDDIEDYMD